MENFIDYELDVLNTESILLQDYVESSPYWTWNVDNLHEDYQEDWASIIPMQNIDSSFWYLVEVRTQTEDKHQFRFKTLAEVFIWAIDYKCRPFKGIFNS